MKISDQELINSIFIQILKKLPEAITINYVGNLKGIVPDDQFWKANSISLHISERAKITSKISKPHLLNRIKDLLTKGKVVGADYAGLSYPLTFTLDDDRLLDAFYFSRNFFIRNGVTEKAVKIDSFENTCDELRALLLEKFAGGAL